MFDSGSMTEAVMLDKMLEVGACFDWITPLVTVAQDLANGPGHTFLIPQECGWSGRDIAGLLRRRGVKSWGLMVVDHSLLVRVTLRQARWAEYILESAGIPLEGGIVAPAAAHSAQRPAWPQAQRADGGVAGMLRDLGDLRLF
jgi:hypothetical protein